jgi:hypothetical protein
MMYRARYPDLEIAIVTLRSNQFAVCAVEEQPLVAPLEIIDALYSCVPTAQAVRPPPVTTSPGMKDTEDKKDKVESSNKVKVAILDIIRTNDPLTTAEIAEHLRRDPRFKRMSATFTARNLTPLAKDGVIEKRSERDGLPAKWYET